MYSYKALQTNATTTQFMIGSSAVTIGRFTYTFSDLEIIEFGEKASLTIGQFSSIAHNVVFLLGGNHRADWITTFPFGHIHQEFFQGQDIIGHPASKGNIVIGNDVWIGRNVTIMSGVTVGDGAIIGAYSVVTKNVEPYAIVAGNPAKHIRFRFAPDICQALQILRWWDLQIDEIKEIIHQLCSQPDLATIQLWIEKHHSSSSF